MQYEFVYQTKNQLRMLEHKIIEIVDNALQWEQNGKQYSKARIKVYANQGAVDYLVVYLLRADSYLHPVCIFFK